jgi:hypothetical protein
MLPEIAPHRIPTTPATAPYVPLNLDVGAIVPLFLQPRVDDMIE